MLSNYEVAFQRLKQVLSNASIQKLNDYHKYFCDQLKNDFIEKAPLEVKGLERYLPHHGVYKRNGDTSKLRIVLDSACKDKEGKCLNDFVHKGENNMGNIVDVIVKFRFGKVAFTADIEKAFLQISLAETERDCGKTQSLMKTSQKIKSFAIA